MGRTCRRTTRCDDCQAMAQSRTGGRSTASVAARRPSVCPGHQCEPDLREPPALPTPARSSGEPARRRTGRPDRRRQPAAAGATMTFELSATAPPSRGTDCVVVDVRSPCRPTVRRLCRYRFRRRGAFVGDDGMGAPGPGRPSVPSLTRLVLWCLPHRALEGASTVCRAPELPHSPTSPSTAVSPATSRRE